VILIVKLSLTHFFRHKNCATKGSEFQSRYYWVYSFLWNRSIVGDKHICTTSGTRAVKMTSAGKDDVTVTVTEAARYRLRQLVRQHPPHDSNVRHCTSLKDDAEKKELVQFNRQRRLRHLGRAQFFTITNDDAGSGSPARCRQVRHNASQPPSSTTQPAINVPWCFSAVN